MFNSIVFHLTNSFPRKFFGRVFSKISKIESKTLTSCLRCITQSVWGDIDLSDSQTQVFVSFHDLFTRKLKDGSRDFQLNVARSFVSPCDAILGEFGEINNETLIQTKGSVYSLKDFLANDREYYTPFLDGAKFVTLRIKPNFYHRAHSPTTSYIDGINFIPGDLWNIDESTLQKIPKLFVKNERSCKK